MRNRTHKRQHDICIISILIIGTILLLNSFRTALNTQFLITDVRLQSTIKHQSIFRWRNVSVTLAIAGQPSITAYKNTIWWWEMGHLWGWNVLQVVKLRRDGRGRGGECSNLSAGYSSEKTQSKKMNVFLSSLQVSLWHSFHCFIKMPEKKKNRAYVSKSEDLVELLQEPGPWKYVIYSMELINVWKAGWHLFQRQLYQYIPHTQIKSGQVTVSVHTVFFYVSMLIVNSH